MGSTNSTIGKLYRSPNMALQIPDASKLVGRCAAAISSDYDNCGAITQCSLSVLTPDQVNSIFMSNAAGTGPGTGAADDRFRVFGDVFAADFEGRAVGIRPNGPYDFLMSQSKIMSPRKMSVTEVAPGMWELTPYIKMKRERAMAEDYWLTKLHAAPANWNPGTVVLLDLSQHVPQGWDDNSATPILPDPLYFPVGQRLFLSGHGASNTGVYRVALEVTDSPAAGQTPPANSVTIAAKVTASDWGTAAAGPIAPGTSPALPPTTINATAGLIYRGTANVSDYEKFCSEIPKVKNEALIPFWVETTRYSMCHDDLTEGYMKALLANNDYYREWIHVDSVQHNRRIIEDFQKRHAYTIFFNNKRPGQTLADYQKPYTGSAGTGLERITTTPPGVKGYASLNQAFFTTPSGANLNAGTGITRFNSSGMVDAAGNGRCIGYKANAEGIYPQLAECGRVVDMLGGNLDLYKFLNTLYVLQRARKNANVPSDIIEVVTDSRTAFKASYALATYFGTQINASAALYHAGAGASPDWYKVGLQLGKECPTNWGFKCTSFPLDWPVCELRFVYNEALDDVLAAYAKITMQAAGRFFWLVDWSSIYVGIIENNTVVNETGTLQDMAKVDETYMCVMKAHGRSQKLVSQTYTVVVEDETTSLIFENIGDQVFAQTTGTRAQNMDQTYIKL